MKITLKPAKGSRFVFSVLPEEIRGRGSARYQNFDIISKGAVKVPRGTEVTEISWDGEFFGKSKRKEALVQTAHWQPPKSCVKTLMGWMEDGTELNLIVSGTWINLDVTIASFSPVEYGAYKNVKYSITFVKSRDLAVYTTKETKAGSRKKTKPRPKKKDSGQNGSASSYYIVKKNDTLIKIAGKNGCKWMEIYNCNKELIEKTAKKHGLENSDKGRWIFPGTKLVIP